jgi:hypothetical protein
VCHLQRKPSFLVVYVRRSVMSIKSVGCDECDTWYRYSCEKLDQHHIKEVESLPLEYVCTNCTTRWGYFQYQNSLQRLSLAASKSVSCGQASARYTSGIWTPDHFVPLLNVPSHSNVSVPQRNRSYSEIVQDKTPDPKLLVFTPTE